MKTRDLIEALQKEDPTGELEVVVGNVPIYFLSREPAYHDGALQSLIQDRNSKYYNITGFKVTTQGSKVQVHTMDLEDCLQNVEKGQPFELDFSELSEQRREEWIARVKRIREEMASWREIDA